MKTKTEKLIFTTRVLLRCLLFFIVVVLHNSADAQVQVQTPVYKRLSANIGGFYESLPVDYSSNPGKKYPLLLFIHGRGELGDGSSAQLPRVKANGPPRVINQGKFPSKFIVGGQEFSFIVVSPQLNEREGIDKLEIMAVIDYCISNYRVDEDRIYITGLSMGGGITMQTVARYSSRFAATVAVCGSAKASGYGAKNITNDHLPVWLTHNSGDATVPLSRSVSWYDSLRARGANPSPKLTVFNVGGHDAWSKTYDVNFRENGLNVYEWMLQYTRGGSSALPPVANAGSNQTITLPVNSVSLDGTKSTSPSGTITGYTWTKISGPSAGSISSAGSSKTNVTGLVEGTYQFQLKVTDSKGGTATATVTVTVNPAPLPPVADAGVEQILTLPANSVTLDGSKSKALSGSIATYQWNKISGPGQGTIVNPSGVSTTVNNLTEGVYVFQLKVTDTKGGIATATVTVTVNAAPIPPIADAGSDQVIDLPLNSVLLDGSNSTAPAGNIVSYKWSKLSGPTSEVIVTPSAATTTVNGLTQGVYQFELKVTDNQGATATATVKVTVNAAPAPPVAVAGADQTITLPVNTVTLDGSASTAPAGNITGYSWSKLSGPTGGVLDDSDKVSTVVTDLEAGEYVYQLTVTDNLGAIATATVIITVKVAPLPPVADAGAAQTITLPLNTVTLDGRGSVAPSGSISNYVWNQLAGPAGCVINSPNNAVTTISGLTEGMYSFELTVTDNLGATSAATVAVTVKAVPLPPVADAGTSQTITLPVNSVNLDGSASAAPSGTISSYQWSKLSGPAGEVIVSPATAATTVTGLKEGVYSFELEVTDNLGATSTAIVTVTVKAALLPPIADAGADETISLPLDSIKLDGSASVAPSGNITDYVWSKLSGPSGEIIVSPASAATMVTGLSEGVYQFQLMVTDNNGLSATSIKTITVSTATTPPIAVAGVNQTITLPQNTVTLDGSASTAPSGSITLYQWHKLSGPATGNITDSLKVSTTVTDLTEGVYKFQLTVTDNLGATSTASVIITVKAAPLPPVANAGTAHTITLPVNSVSLDGSASTAPAGSISSYTWSKLSGPVGGVIIAPSNATTTVTGLTEGVYSFQLTVADNLGATSNAAVSVTVKAAPLPPVADAGTAQTITLPLNSVNLDGSGSVAPSGSISGYAWSKLSGPAGEVISTPTNAATTVTGLKEGVYKFELVVTDNLGATSTAVVTINVKPAPLPPVANAGDAKAITLQSNTIVLDAGKSAAAPGNLIVSYYWRKISGPVDAAINDADNVTTSVTGLTEGVYTFQVEVTDDKGGKAAATVTITVNAAPPPPIADAGNNQTIVLPLNSVSLDGSSSRASGGSIVSYAWSKVSGPAGGTIVDALQPKTGITGLVEGKYQYRLTVTDNRGVVASAIVFITVNAAPLPPVANAGNAQTIVLPVNSVVLDGSQSTAPGGSIVSYAWSKVSGPKTGLIKNAGNSVTTVDELTAGTYVFALKVTDSNGNTATANVTVVVNPAPVVPPVANAGSDISLQLPQELITLDGRKSYAAKGTIAKYRWDKISGPGSLMIINSGMATPVIQKIEPGIYVFRLTVTDSNGIEDSDEVTITIIDKEIKLPPPVANAGETRTIPLSDEGTYLDAGLSYAQFGSIEKYSWVMLSGPSEAKIDYADSDLALVSGLAEGEYIFELTVTDNNGKESKATVKIVVANSGARKDLSPVIRVFPNPVKDLTTVELQGPAKGRTSINVYDAAGKKLYGSEFIKDDIYVNHQLNTAGLKSGIYFVEVVIDYQFRSVIKMIKL